MAVAEKLWKRPIGVWEDSWFYEPRDRRHCLVNESIVDVAYKTGAISKIFNCYCNSHDQLKGVRHWVGDLRGDQLHPGQPNLYHIIISVYSDPNVTHDTYVDDPQ